MTERTLIKIATASRRLMVCDSRVRALIRMGRLEGKNINGAAFVYEDSVEQFKANRK